MRSEIIPAYALIDYTWDVLQANTDMDKSDYNGKTPIIPSSQQPEFTEFTSPFLVYAYTENPTDIDVPPLRSGQIAYAVYGTTDRQISNIINILAVAFGRWDETAYDINDWAVGSVFQGIRFTNTSIGIIEGPAPESQEGGRKSGVIMIRFGYTTTYDVMTRNFAL